MVGSPEPDITLSMLRSYQEQHKLQREVMDRWFGYYLIIIGIPLPLLGGLLQVEGVRMSLSHNLAIVAPIAFFYFVVGLIFFLMHVRQRINSIRWMNRIKLIEAELLTKLPTVPKPEATEPFGADFWAGVVHIFVNTVWFVAGVYLCGLNGGWLWVLLVVILVAILGIQYSLRKWMLRSHEAV